MCANYTPAKLRDLEMHFGVHVSEFKWPPEAFPGYMAPILRQAHDAPGQIECAPACYGMVPHWADIKLARQTYNARTDFRE